MKIRYSFTITGLLIIALLFSCSGGGDGNETPDPEPVPDPVATTLIFPENNTECNEGEILNANQSRVLFQWNASPNTDSYQVNLRNLNTNNISSVNSNTTEAPIVLSRGVPYEWSVVSRATGTSATATSVAWRFYNAGAGVSNYAPFPAVAIAPSRGATINAAPTTTLEWSASDIDNDISSFRLFFGVNPSPEVLAENLTETNFEVNITSGQRYYWQVETFDNSGNSSVSELFEFQVN